MSVQIILRWRFKTWISIFPSHFLQTLKWHGKIKNLKTAFKSVIIFPFLKLKKKREKKDEDITITPLRTEAEKKVSTSI